MSAAGPLSEQDCSRLVLVACSSTKRPVEPGRRLPAEELYASDLFRKSRDYAREFGTAWAILSAKHGLVLPSTMLRPYDLTLNDLDAAARRSWCVGVVRQLFGQPWSPRNLGEVVILAGAHYREKLVDELLARNVFVHVPVFGLGIGRQLQQLKRATTQPLYRAHERHRLAVAALLCAWEGRRND